jgi:hypothetical protein
MFVVARWLEASGSDVLPKGERPRSAMELGKAPDERRHSQGEETQKHRPQQWHSNRLLAHYALRSSPPPPHLNGSASPAAAMFPPSAAHEKLSA